MEHLLSGVIAKNERKYRRGADVLMIKYIYLISSLIEESEESWDILLITNSARWNRAGGKTGARVNLVIVD